MHPDSTIPQDTITAYLQTRYHVLGQAPFVLHIGTPSAALAALHKAGRVCSSAFITACNPYSQTLSDAANVQRQADLEQELKTRGLPYLEGLGQHPSNQWPGEPSFLVLGLSREAAKVLGARFEQNAVVWFGGDALGELVVLR